MSESIHFVIVPGHILCDDFPSPYNDRTITRNLKEATCGRCIEIAIRMPMVQRHYHSGGQSITPQSYSKIGESAEPDYVSTRMPTGQEMADEIKQTISTFTVTAFDLAYRARRGDESAIATLTAFKVTIKDADGKLYWPVEADAPTIREAIE